MYVFKSENAAHRKAILAALFEIGLKWHDGADGEYAPQRVEDEFPFDEYPIIVWDKEEYSSGIGLFGDSDIYDKYNSLDSFLKEEANNIPKITVIDLNDDCEAKIKRDSIEVGCQTIPFEKVEEVYNIMKELRK